MCNGSSTRTSQGGSIAVLRPTKNRSLCDLDSDENWQLLFTNQTGNKRTQGTIVELNELGNTRKIQRAGHWVVIHRDGDLSVSSACVPPNELPSDPFFSFSLEANSTSITQLPQRLELGVGNSGIIGRKVSVMTRSTEGPMTVAEGIIGWN